MTNRKVLQKIFQKDALLTTCTYNSALYSGKRSPQAYGFRHPPSRFGIPFSIVWHPVKNRPKENVPENMATALPQVLQSKLRIIMWYYPIGITVYIRSVFSLLPPKRSCRNLMRLKIRTARRFQAWSYARFSASPPHALHA